MISKDLPLVELHRHLDGAIRLQTIIELADAHGIGLPARDAEGLAPYVHIDRSAPGLMAFIARFEYMTAVLVDEAGILVAAFQGAAEETVRAMRIEVERAVTGR